MASSTTPAVQGTGITCSKTRGPFSFRYNINSFSNIAIKFVQPAELALGNALEKHFLLALAVILNHDKGIKVSYVSTRFTNKPRLKCSLVLLFFLNLKFVLHTLSLTRLKHRPRNIVATHVRHVVYR
jgi:hypothetical protein